MRDAFELSGSDIASLPRRLSRAALPFAHEDLAIVLGAYILANHLMPVGFVIAGIAGAILASDFALYAIGAGARRLPWLERHAVDARVRGLSEAFRRDLFALIALCRFVPGLVVVAGIACGWARVSFARFAAATIAVSASYVVMMLYLVTTVGDALDDHIGLWTWPLLFALLAAAAFARQRILAFRGETPWRGQSIRLR
jgi:membrane protein DedA with SNARE-associated domain